ncbi:MAG: DUF6484 domain-containing protein [Planctomycetota bacterium]
MELETRNAAKALRIDGARLGKILEILPENRYLVDFDGNPFGPAIARYASFDPQGSIRLAAELPPVVLVFENGDPEKPFIVGALASPAASTTVPSDPDSAGEAVSLPTTIVLRAEEEIVLQCGDSLVSLSRDGKLLIRGTNITSRATQTHRIKGGSVRIN